MSPLLALPALPYQITKHLIRNNEGYDIFSPTAAAAAAAAVVVAVAVAVSAVAAGDVGAVV